MDENGGVLPVPDTPETRLLWLSDFTDAWIRNTLRKLLEAGFAELILKDNQRGFRLTTLGRMCGIDNPS
jgi:hypothetical protein